jgi:hypothetical protein
MEAALPYLEMVRLLEQAFIQVRNALHSLERLLEQASIKVSNTLLFLGRLL